jgi:hypothetical protein
VQCKYKKSTIFSTGAPKIFFDFLRGVLTHMLYASHRGLPGPVPVLILRSGVNRLAATGFVPVWCVGQCSQRLEKRSQAPQAVAATFAFQTDAQIFPQRFLAAVR